MSQEAQLAFHALWPAVAVSGAAMVAAWRPWRRGGSERARQHGHWGAALACGLGFIASFLVLTRGWRGWPPPERWQWLLPMAVGATAIGLLAGVWRPRGGLRYLPAVALAVVAAVLLHPPLIYQPVLAWKAGLAGMVLLTFVCLEPLADRRVGASLPLSLAIVFAGGSQVIVQSRFAALGFAAAAASATWATCLAIALFNRRVSFAHGGIHVAAVLLPALMMIGWFYNIGEVGLVSSVLVCGAPMLLWLGELGFVRSLKSWQGVLVRAMVVAVPIAIAVGLAMRATQDE